MTAHAAQGKTRLYNVVHLNSCFNHMSYYSSLSRSASAAGTVIIQGFDTKVITRGCSGYLRQEFREQELLDEITRLRYEGQLPDDFKQEIRSVMIHQFQLWKGTDYIPPKTDAALKWSQTDPLDLVSVVDDSLWQLVNKNIKQKQPAHVVTSFIPAKGSELLNDRKHKLEPSIQSPAKKARATQGFSSIISPTGLIWDNDNYSCAYDSLLVILFDIWKDNQQEWSNIFRNINQHCTTLSEGFLEISRENITFEQVRDHFRSILYMQNPVMFPRGTHGISVTTLAQEMFKVDYYIASSQHQCPRCDYAEIPIDDKLGYVLHADNTTRYSTHNWINTISQSTHRRCPDCNNKMKQVVFYNNTPHIIILEYPFKDIKTSHQLEFVAENGEIKILKLRGIVYHGGYHFTSRIISSKQEVWYHDGITTRNLCTSEDKLVNISDLQLRRCRNKDLVLAIYAQTI
jgi:hypothetical protein